MTPLQRVLRGAALLVWLLATAWLWPRSPAASVGLLALGAVVVLWRLLRPIPPGSEPVADGAVDAEQAARVMVTGMLREITRVQVAYLSQDFVDARQALRWLKQAVPRSMRSALPQLSADLEQARQGQPPASLDLPVRILALRRELDAMDQALKRAATWRADHAVAHPAVFVVTAGVGGEGEAADQPLVVSVAGFDPEKPSLLPPVDALTLFVQREGSRRVLGQIPFDKKGGPLAAHLRRLDDAEGEVLPPVFVNTPAADATALDLPLAKIPLGFLVGTSEAL